MKMETINKKRIVKEKIKCECGYMIQIKNLNKHKETKTHFNKLNDKYIKNYFNRDLC